MYEQKTPVRKTILLQLDVMVADENEDFLEAEITHPRLSGAMYLTVNSRKELEDELNKIDISGEEEEEESEERIFANTYQAPSSVPSNRATFIPSNKPILSHQLPVPDSANSVESLIKNTFNIASGLMELRTKLKKK